MATSKNIILAFLLVCALFGNVFAQMIPPPWYETETVKKNSLEKTTNDPQNPNTEFNNGKSTVVIDSIAIYYKMINLEHAEAKYTANAVGMVGGGLLTALGIACIISANNNIPRIKKIIEKLSLNYGKEIDFHGKKYSFRKNSRRR